MRALQPSAARAALKLVLDEVRRRGDAPPSVSAPKRRAAVERGMLRVSPGRLRAFLSATGGDGIAAFEDAAAPLPPTVASLWETALALELLSVAGVGLPRGGLIHLESEVVPIRAMPSAEHFRCRVELDRTEQHPRGTRLTLQSRCWTAAGQLCLESVVKLLARDVASAGQSRSQHSARSAFPEAATGDESEWRTLAEWRVAGNQGRRFARISGDFNPIHLWPWSARLMGFRAPVLHGACIEAMVAHVIIAEVLGGDPRALRRLHIAFRAPLFLPAPVQLQFSECGGAPCRFRLVDPDRAAARPYAEGTFAGQRPPESQG